MAEQGIVKVLKSDDPTILPVVPAGYCWYGTDATGFWIKTGSTVVRPDVGTGINWSEDFTVIPFLVDNVWTTVNLAGYEDKLIEVVLRCSANNLIVGLREEGSALVRSMRIDNDSTVTMSVRVDSSGDIQLYSSKSSDTTFTIQAIWQ